LVWLVLASGTIVALACAVRIGGNPWWVPGDTGAGIGVAHGGHTRR
jgi:hypothetical protein